MGRITGKTKTKEVVNKKVNMYENGPFWHGIGDAEIAVYDDWRQSYETY